MNKIRPSRGGLSTSYPVGSTKLPGRTIFSLCRRVNTPTGTIMTGNSRIGMNAMLTRTRNFMSYPIRSSMSKGIDGISTVMSTDNCHHPTVFVSMRNSR